eukprot:m.160694 g.160694  ORF g.160694 m.160694 type:complete len:114 (+) comp11981_c0_seq1:281-622(+)
MGSMSDPTEQMVVPTQDELFNVLACCCYQLNCYKTAPCRGCIGETRCLCIECHNHCRWVEVTTCIKQVHQNLCCDIRCALPCDEDVPFLIGACGILCFGRKDQTYKDIDGRTA